MIIKEDKQRLHRLLADAIPLLCKSGLPRKASFCIEALIGITLEDGEVMLVSFKQQIHADQDLTMDEYLDSTVGDEEAAARRVSKTSYLPVTMDGRKTQNDRHTDIELLEGRSGRNTSKSFSHGKGGKRALPRNVVLPVVKVEDVDLKMDEDIGLISSAGVLQSERQGDFVTDSLSWNFHKYNTFPVSKFSAMETVSGDDECAGIVSRGSWKGDRRSGNKIGRKRTGQSSNGSVSHEERTYVTLPDDGSKEWHRKRKDGRTDVVTAVSSNSTSLSYAGDAQGDGRLHEPSAETQDSCVNRSISNIQLTDDRISLEQTSKILSSYRFVSSDDNIYSCHICEAKLRGRQTLNEHIRGTHLCAHIYRCSNCGLSFKWRSGLQRHRSKCVVATSTPETTQLPNTNA